MLPLSTGAVGKLRRVAGQSASLMAASASWIQAGVHEVVVAGRRASSRNSEFSSQNRSSGNLLDAMAELWTWLPIQVVVASVQVGVEASSGNLALLIARLL